MLQKKFEELETMIQMKEREMKNIKKLNDGITKTKTENVSFIIYIYVCNECIYSIKTHASESAAKLSRINVRAVILHAATIKSINFTYT